MFSISGIRAHRRAVKLATRNIAPLDDKGGAVPIDYVCAHYTMAGLSFIIRFKDGSIVQRKVEPTPKAVAGMFTALEG